MFQNNKYPLAITGAFLLGFFAQAMLLASHIQAGMFEYLPTGLSILVGMLFHVVSAFLFSSVILNYEKPVLNRVYFCATACLLFAGWGFIRAQFVVEGVVIIMLAVAFILACSFSFKLDWLTETMLWANMVIGAGLAFRPAVFISSPVYALFQKPVVDALALFFGSTALISLVLQLAPGLVTVKPGRILAIPWVFWGIMLIYPFHFLNAFVAGSLIFGLILGEYLPWEKLVLVKGAYIGRRFIGLVLLAQLIFLGLLIWMNYVLESNLSTRLAEVLQIREISLLSFNILTVVGAVVILSINLTINGLFSGLYSKQPLVRHAPEKPARLWLRISNNFLEPFNRSHNLLREHVLVREEVETLLARQQAVEKRRMAQLSLIHRLNIELENVLDPPVTAQLTANAIFTALGCALVNILQFDPAQDEVISLASSGPLSNILPPAYRQKTSFGLIGRAARLHRTQLVSDTRLDPEFVRLENQTSLSEMVVPLMHRNKLQGVILVDAHEVNGFDDSDIRTIETIGVQLVTAWQRSAHDERLTNLINAGITLSTTLDVDGVTREIAQIAQRTLDALFVFVALVDKGDTFSRTAYIGYAPTLLSVLNSDPASNTLIQAAINSSAAFRIRDVRKRYTSTLTGSSELRNMLAVSIRVRQSSIGAILVFGKTGHQSFSENDESLISLLATQAAAAIETTMLYQELRSMLSVTTQLYSLSTRVIQSAQLTDAAAAIAETAYKLSEGSAAGIVLTPSGAESGTRVQIDDNGLHTGAQHPTELVAQALESGQTIISPVSNQSTFICIPLQTPRRQYGAMWVEVPENHLRNTRYTDNLHTLANQAVIALERSLLIIETRQQSVEIETAYHELETTYDLTLGALSSSLDARDRETEGHSLRVARIAQRLGVRLGLEAEQAKILERGSILHDIGKIGISDTVLLKPGPLSDEEWQVMRQHPDIGARIIEGIPFLQDALPVIRFHQERWDGSGYPSGLKGREIPLLARIFAIVDAFDALTNDRPYRKRSPVGEAVDFLKEKSGILFDPEVVEEFSRMVDDGEIASLM